MITCPKCGGTNIIGDATVTVRFTRNANGAITVVSDYCDLIEQIGDEAQYECQDCGEIFERGETHHD